ncbi:MAG TPA: ribonuclease PH [Pseudomonadota bacterium]|nr:ribonuclease PH [Pseudomonadota bacterium]HNF97804.1 ribonuclease PH [Pseudomonadota bacterium]
MRSDGREAGQLRQTVIEVDYLSAPLACALVRSGSTWVLCTASVDEQVPPFLRPKPSADGQRNQPQSGWVTAEYSMLPGSTGTRSSRAPSGRSKEIERLIGRSLRQAVDLTKLGPRTITIDCDVLQADGGTRTASITGGYVALALAVKRLMAKGLIRENPLKRAIAAVSVGIIDGQAYLDLPYEEDSRAEVDMNVVMAQPQSGGEPAFVEVQGTGEHGTFSRSQLDALLGLAEGGIGTLFALQQAALAAAR